MPRFAYALLGVVVTALLARTAPPDPAAPPAPVPADKAVEDAETLIRDVHKADFARKKPVDQVELARRLLKEADETADNPAARFVLYRAARDLAARGGDVPLAVEAADATARAFSVKPADLLYAALDAAEKARVAPGKAVTEAALDAVEVAVRADDYPAAERLLKLAATAAGRSAGAGLAAAVAAQVKDVAADRKAFEALAADRNAVATGTADPAARGRVGRFLCLVKGDWEAGLPLAAGGDDEKLKAVAELEQAKPGKADEKAAVADRWWDLSTGLTGGERAAARTRAYHWYREAFADLTGLSKTRVEKRLAEIEKAEPRVTRALGAWTVIFRSAEPAIWNTASNAGKDQFALPLDKVPAGVKYLKLTHVARRSFVVIEVGKAQLDGLSDQDGFGWVGKNQNEHGGHHLGVYNLAWQDFDAGKVIVCETSARHARGWGFGHRASIHDRQGYAWNGEPIEKTVFEVAVKATSLSAEERGKLLKK